MAERSCRLELYTGVVDGSSGVELYSGVVESLGEEFLLFLSSCSEAVLLTTNRPLFRPTVASGLQLLSFRIPRVFFILNKILRVIIHITLSTARP